MRVAAAFSLLLLIGLITGAGMLVYAAYVVLALVWISHFCSQRWTSGLSATRTIERGEIEIGESIGVQLRLENRDSLPIPWLLIDDVLPKPAIFGPPPALKLDGNNVRLCSVARRASRILAYRLTGLRRGYFQLGPALVETGDLLGLYRKFRSVTGPTPLLVLPKLIPLEGYDVASRRPVGDVMITYRLFEDPTLVSGVREYRNGDSMRTIHWRASARTGTLQCKQYQPTCVAGATLVLDMHRDSNPDRHEPIRSDLAVTAAASIFHALLQSGQQFGLLSNGRDAADRFLETGVNSEYQSLNAARNAVSMHEASDRLRPIVLTTSRGTEHFHRAHRLLARLERSEGLQLEQLLQESHGRLPRDASVVIVIQEISLSAAQALGMLRRQGYSVTAIVNNYENDAYEQAVSRLLSQRINVHHLLSEESIPHICRQVTGGYS
jgi:uncharacterized protein (DUF58 family)